MGISPLKPNPWMAVLPVNLGWLPNKPVLGWRWGGGVVLPCRALFWLRPLGASWLVPWTPHR